MADWTLHLGDCLAVLPTLPAGSVDAVVADPPWGTTACAWDAVIPFTPMWREVKRLLRPHGVAVFMAGQPFASALVMSNPGWFRHEWVWEKTRPSGFVHCNRGPLKAHEQVLVFSPGGMTYYAQMTPAPRCVEGERRVKAHAAVCQSDRVRRFDNNGLAYPRSVLRFANPNHANSHPTQKPVALMEYFVRTYTNEGDTVLDFCAGSGTTGVACLRTGRRFVGIEKAPAYHETARKRLADVRGPLFAAAAGG